MNPEIHRLRLKIHGVHPLLSQGMKELGLVHVLFKNRSAGKENHPSIHLGQGSLALLDVSHKDSKHISG